MLCLVVKERESSDQGLVSSLRQVVTDELPESQHGKASVAEFVRPALFHGLVIHVDWKCLQASLGVRVQVVDRADKKEEDGPEESRDHIEGVESVGNVLEGNAWSKVTRETDHFRNNVAKDSEHGDAAVLDLTKLVAFESRCVPTVADAKRVEESCRAIAQITHKSVAGKETKVN